MSFDSEVVCKNVTCVVAFAVNKTNIVPACLFPKCGSEIIILLNSHQEGAFEFNQL